MLSEATVNCDFSGHDVLTKPRACDHAAHLYTDADSLLSAAEQYVSAGLDRGDAALVIVTRSHMDGLMHRLSRSGRDCNALRASGQLVTLDAPECLSRLMNGRELRYDVFQSFSTELIEEAQRSFGGLCAFGEMVNLLWHQGNVRAANTLEQWWNALIGQYGFTVLCSYQLNSLDDEVQDELESICRTHSHLIPTLEPNRFDRAVEAALREIMPNGQVEDLQRDLANQCRRGTSMPASQAALFALNDILPSLAQDVRMLARDYYYRGG